VAVNGADVLRALERRPYDVILMDVQMPEMDGLEATRRIRRHLVASRQPYVIAMTANAMEGDREMCLESGMDDYLSKPVYLAELRAAFQRAADRIAAWPAAGRQLAAPCGAAAAGPAPPDLDPDDPVLDRPRALAAGRDLAELFVREADTTLRQLRQASRDDDIQGVRQAAHRLKGGGGYFGAVRVVDLSARIERAARAGTMVDASAVVGLGDELDRLHGELVALFGGRAEPAGSATSVRGPTPPLERTSNQRAGVRRDARDRAAGADRDVAEVERR
jgi:CheY-like chemotaxis protein/HPt (histidine-containing phosphotransfer) domain-containing protein